MYQSDLYSNSRPNVGVTIAPFIYEDNCVKVLLYKRSKTADVFPNLYSLPNRFFDIRDFETLELAATYALEEKTNIAIPQMVQFHTFSGQYIDPSRIITVNTCFYSILRKNDVINTENKHDFETIWVDVLDAKKLNLAFNHNEVLDLAFEKVCNSAEYTTSPVHFLEYKFTISELRTVTEHLLNKKLDNSRYRDRISKSGILITCDGEMRKRSNRPAQLYRYNTSFLGYFYPISVTKSTSD